ncbi:MAG: hypothetical protein J5J06_15870 [Phycisphaerae bacterium]|nr:hypothetical protein [Phycisphaerae bacterium]
MNSLDRVARFMAACGSDTPRLVSHMPCGGWLNAAVKACAIAGCGPHAQKRVEILIDAAIKRGRFIDRQRKAPATITWIQAALDEHARLPFRAILSNQRITDSPVTLNVEDDLSDETLWNPPRSVTIQRTIPALVETLRPMLQLARKVVIIEPNFDIGSRSFTEPLRAMLLEANKTPPDLKLVELHMTNSFDGLHNYLADECREQIELLIPANVNAEIYLWEGGVLRGNTSATDRLHDRFMLTNRGGVMVGWGFDTRPGSQTTITLLDDTTCREIERDVSCETRRFRMAGRSPIQFTGRAMPS